MYLIRNKLQEDIKRRSNKKIRKDRYDNLTIYFLNRIIEFCNENNITILFLYTPMHNKLIQNQKLYKQFYKENYNNIMFYDFRDMHFPDSCFGDLDHLNYKGAKVFSEYFEKEVLHKQNYTD